MVDDKDVDVFIVRNAEARLSDRDATVVNDWQQKKSQGFHCIRDHPKHAASAIVDGLWGGIPKVLRPLLNDSMQGLLTNTALNNASNDFLHTVLWPRVKQVAFCHDSVSCSKWPNAHKFPIPRSQNLEYVSEVYDIYQQSLAVDKTVLSVNDTQCVIH